jgi:hypothetical protein
MMIRRPPLLPRRRVEVSKYHVCVIAHWVFNSIVYRLSGSLQEFT